VRVAAKVLSAAVGLAIVLPAAAGPPPQGIKWRPSLPAAMTEARKANGLIMIDFYTDWCGWCKKLDSTTFKNADVVQLSKQVIPVKVNADKAGAQAARFYSVSSFPTILFVNRFGKVLNRVEGYLKAKEFAAETARALNAHKPKAK
jgi:thiol:disulfide interchange protein